MKKTNIKKRVAIYLPNLSKIGGGAEVYVLYLAKVLSEKYKVVVYTKRADGDYPTIKQIYRMYNVQAFPTRIVNSYQGKNYILRLIDNYIVWQRINKDISKKYDLYINGSRNRLFGVDNVKSFHIIHFPEKRYSNDYPIIGRYFDRKYITSYSGFIVNSNFTKGYFKEYWNKEGVLLYPPISMKSIKTEELENKQNIILTVGRLAAEKKIIEMIDAFKKLNSIRKADYKFVICGNEYGEDEYVRKIKESIKGYPIELMSNVPYEKLVEMYKKAKIYWHAMGYKVSDESPLKMEHFGMTTVEAMSNGCIPVVINKAGQKEIIGKDEYGYVWDSIDELIEKTESILDNKIDISEVQKKVIARAETYQLEAFNKNAKKIFDVE